MAEKFRGKYRIGSKRLKNWDYSSNGAYFLTIVTKNRQHFFGKIVEDKMQLSNIGEIALKYWESIPQHFPFIILDEMVIMPDHIHMILWIDRVEETPKLGVSSTDSKWKPGTIGVIINQYKRICTINSRKINPNFSWQSRYYDHIIRSEQSLLRIRNYIIENPKMWNRDGDDL